jgi:hypothetical protein
MTFSYICRVFSELSARSFLLGPCGLNKVWFLSRAAGRKEGRKQGRNKASYFLQTNDYMRTKILARLLPDSYFPPSHYIFMMSCSLLGIQLHVTAINITSHFEFL